MSLLRKIFTAKVILPILGVLIVLGAGAYYYFQIYLPSKEPSADQSEDPTKDWKTFMSGEFGFSIEYPDDWSLVVEKSLGVKGFFFVSPNQDLSTEEIGEKKATGYSAIALYRPLFAVLPIGEFDHHMPDSDQIESRQPITIKGRPFNIAVYKGGYVVVAEKYDPEVTDRSSFRIEFYPGTKNSLPSEFFDQMFGTLKFLNSIKGWNTYSNEEAGYSIKYPKGWYLYSDGAVAVTNYDRETAPGRGYAGEKGIFKVEIFPLENKDGKPLENWLVDRSKEEQEGQFPPEVISEEEIVINGINGIKREDKATFLLATFYFPKGDIVFLVTCGLDYEGNKDYCNSIVSTFEFL